MKFGFLSRDIGDKKVKESRSRPVFEVSLHIFLIGVNGDPAPSEAFLEIIGIIPRLIMGCSDVDKEPISSIIEEMANDDFIIAEGIVLRTIPVQVSLERGRKNSPVCRLFRPEGETTGGKSEESKEDDQKDVFSSRKLRDQISSSGSDQTFHARPKTMSTEYQKTILKLKRRHE